jgi:hypothetical protein
MARPLPPTSRLDALVALALALLAGAIVLAASRQLDPRLANPLAGDVWFASDIPYRLEVMRAPGGWENGGAHPLFPSIGHAFLAATAPFTRGTDPMRKAAAAGALAAGLFAAVLYALFRKMRLPPLDAGLFAAVAATSAGALFWFSVPESFGLAGLGVALALLVAATARPSAAALALACVASASCILTNGIVGAIATFTHHPRPRQWLHAIAIGAAALLTLAALFLFQERGRDTPFFLSDRLLEYQEHLYPVSLDRTAQVLQGLLSHAVVAPEPQSARPSFRRVAIATNGPAGIAATLAWLALLGFGIARTVALARRGERPELAVTAIGSLVLVVGMHLTLGREMFLYAMDVLPLLLALAAASACLPGDRRWVRPLVVLLLLAGTLNNVRQFQSAAATARTLAEERVGTTVSAPR